jgi:DNA-binding MarR family transcriptional regulator
MVQVSDRARADDATRSFLLASRALVGVAARSLAETADITLPQFRALVRLSQRPGSAVSDLAGDLDIHPTTATRLVDRLVRKRLVRRRTLESDRRVTQLFLTASGRDLVDRVTRRRMREIARIVGRMPEDSWAAVTDAMSAFAAAAGEPTGGDLFAWDARVS